MLSKTKVNVDHAGLSHQPLQLKVLILLKLDLFLSFQNNNLLIVTLNQADVMEDLKLGLLNTQKLLPKNWKLIIHTMQKMEFVNTQRPKVKLMLFHMFKFQREVLPNSKLPLMFNQLVFQLKLIKQSSNPIKEVSLIQLDVELTLTMQSLLLDMELKMELITLL